MPALTLEARPAAMPDPLGRIPVVVTGAEPEALVEIRRPEVNLAVWTRDLPPGLDGRLRALAEAAPFTALAEDLPEAAVDALAAQLPHPAPLALLQDIRALATAFAAIARTGGAVRIRLEGIDDEGCHRWHADAVGLRLLCTYHGPGTEWLALAGGARVARGLDPKALPVAPGRLALSAAAILKGEAYPGNAGFGCIHRSPPAAP
ncbi:DUF1826 domain-containing protein, partial [Falsiroseomonas oryziterrae]|uniref:DUF1826 domain-containing protein n=1 Tax=Falsiroseomonas oryziterrae TaxID=2911368 RepID=UPI001F2C42F9